MKYPFTILLVSTISTAVLIGACKKQGPSPSPAVAPESQKTTTAGDEVQKALGNVTGEAQKQVEAVKASAQNALADAQKQAIPQSDTQAQTVIDQAKALVAGKKYADALALLQQKLPALKLNAEQQSIVDALGLQIQKATATTSATEAAGKAGNLLGK